MFVSKINDVCQCYCVIDEMYVVGNIVTGAQNVIVNGLPVATMLSIVQGSCGHIGLVTCTTKNTANGLPIATFASNINGIIIGNIITCSTNVGSL